MGVVVGLGGLKRGYVLERDHCIADRWLACISTLEGRSCVDKVTVESPTMFIMRTACPWIPK
jgi:hypothetical protein